MPGRSPKKRRAAPVGGPHRRHLVYRRRGPARFVRHAHAATTRRADVRQPAPQVAVASGRCAGLSGARGGIAVRAQHEQRALLHHRSGAVGQSRASDRIAGRIRSGPDCKPAATSGVLRAGCGHQSRGRAGNDRVAADRGALDGRGEAGTGERRAGARRSSGGPIRGGAPAGRDQYRLRRTARVVGRDRAGIVGERGDRSRISGAGRRDAHAAGARRNRTHGRIPTRRNDGVAESGRAGTVNSADCGQGPARAARRVQSAGRTARKRMAGWTH